MSTISKQQPMRPAEIDLIDQVNTNTDNIATQTARLTQEITDRTNADDALGNRITSETNRATAAESTLTQNLATEVSDRKAADTTLQGNIDAEVIRAKAAEEANATAISNEVTARENDVKGNADAITALQGKFPVASTDLAEDIQQQLTFLQSVPAMEFGTSNSVDVSANSNTSVDITFGSVKTEAPVVLCGLQHESGNLACIVTGVTNSQCSVKVYNLTSTDVTGVTVDYIAISGR